MLFCARIDTLIRLLLKHRHIDPSKYFKLIRILLVSLLLQRYIKSDDRLYDKEVKYIDIKEDPVFIVGHWRSGTTHLYNLISLDTDNFSYPTTYQCFFPTIFLTLGEGSRFFKIMDKLFGTRTRLIDNIELSLNSPQEEEWMYLPEGAFSYYEHLIFPKTPVPNIDQLIELSNNKKSREITLKIFKKLTFIKRCRIIAKSPGHFSRIPVLKELFPNSKFIFLIRNPYDTIISMIHTKSLLSNIFRLQKRSHDDIIFTARFFKNYYDSLERNIYTLDNSHFIFIKYEDLIRDQLKSICNIYQILNIEYNRKYKDKLTEYLDSLRNYTRNKFEMPLQMKELIYNECRDIFQTYDYKA